MDEPVDVLETVIAYLLSLTALRDLVGERISDRHQFSQVQLPDEQPRGWPTPAPAITLRYAGNDGDPDTATCYPHARVRLEARCWGGSSREAARVWGVLVAACHGFTRSTVDLPDGRTALLAVLWPADGPTGEIDPDITMDYLRLTLRAHASSTPV